MICQSFYSSNTTMKKWKEQVFWKHEQLLQANEKRNNPVEKWAKDMTRHFTEEKMWMVSKHENIWSQLVIKEIQMKTRDLHSIDYQKYKSCVFSADCLYLQKMVFASSLGRNNEEQVDLGSVGHWHNHIKKNKLG